MRSDRSVSTRVEKVRWAKETLDRHVQDLAEAMRQGQSENLLRYLEYAARFHRYSFRNILLALCQRPDISRLAGLRQWNQLGRRVRAGEKGILILAPMTVKRKREQELSNEDETGEVVSLKTVTLFKPVYVFDVAQTEGDPLPTVIHAVGDVLATFPALQEAVRSNGIALDFVESVPGSPGAHGCSTGGRICIRADLGSADGFRALAHEYAHELLHWDGDKDSKTVVETEADAVAFVVCRHFGVEASAADYLLLYHSSPEVLLERMETISQTAARIIEDILHQNMRIWGEEYPVTDDEKALYGRRPFNLVQGRIVFHPPLPPEEARTPRPLTFPHTKKLPDESEVKPSGCSLL